MTAPDINLWAESAGCLLLFAAGWFLLVSRREVARLRGEIRDLRVADRAREKAEAASLSKSRFLAMVSHEIRTPLNGVMGLAQLLGMTRLDAEQASYVEMMGNSGRALAQLIDDILDFSQIEAGKLNLGRETFALAPLIEGVVELLAPRALAKGLEIASFVSPSAPREYAGDPARLRQVLINLVGNALNYTERGGVGVRLYVEGATLRLDVRDTGPGVPAAAREAIFEEFERGDSAATRRQGGAGLGLAISRRLVSLMGGTLTLGKAPCDGAVFSVALPVPGHAAESPPRKLAGQRVLIVAESRFEGPYLAETLAAAGADSTIMTAEGASKRLPQKDAEPFDAVIVDCALGAAAVSVLARAARAGGARRLFLLFSPLERRAFGEEAVRDFDGWLVKPLRSDSLLARLASPASDSPARAAAAEPLRIFESFNVLVAEDNDVNALILTRCLGKLGAVAARARDGAEAVALAASGLRGDAAPYDVIVMDLFMPELDGRQATRRIREAEHCAGAPRTPIIALTASALEADAQALHDAGVDAFLTKPVDLSALAAKIEELHLSPRVQVTPRAQVGASAAYAPVGAMVPNLPER